MNFLSFEYFLAICRAGTLRGAAETLYISPQALSEHLNKLEKKLGVPLFLRTKPLTLTAAGSHFLTLAETCLAAKKEFDTELEAVARENENRLSLGVPIGMPPPLLLSFLAYFRRLHPELTVSVTELPSRTGAFAEIPRHVDAVFGELRGDESRVQHRTILRSGRFVVALRRELLYASLAPAEAERAEVSARGGVPVDMALFRGCPFVRKRSGSIIRQNENRLFHAAGYTPTGSMETGDMEMTVRLVLLGEAAVFFPEPVARANLVIPASFETDRSLLLCPVRTEAEEWVLSLGVDRYRSVPAGVAVLEEAARNYYEKMLGTAEPLS